MDKLDAQENEVKRFQIKDYEFLTMSQKDAESIVLWQYESTFSLYNMHASSRNENTASLLNPKNNYFVVYDTRGELIAFRCFGPEARVAGGTYHDDALDTGGGLRPDLTGKGYGLSLLLAGVELGKTLFQPKFFRVTVAAFNTRALKVCERAGFVKTEIFQRPVDRREFIILETRT